jgi:hypothetical protein
MLNREIKIPLEKLIFWHSNSQKLENRLFFRNFDPQIILPVVFFSLWQNVVVSFKHDKSGDESSAHKKSIIRVGMSHQP